MASVLLALFLQKKRIITLNNAVETLKPPSNNYKSLLGQLVYKLNSHARYRILHRRFNKWKQMAVDEEQRKIIEEMREKLKKLSQAEALKKLKFCLLRTKDEKFKKVLRKFKQNQVEYGYIQKFMKILLKNKVGQAITTFYKWRTIPSEKEEQDQKPALKAYFGLLKFIKRNVKDSYEKMKDLHLEGQAKQKSAVREVIYKTMGDLKRRFLQWNNYAQQMRNARKCKITMNFLLSLNRVASNSYRPIYEGANFKLKKYFIKLLIKSQTNKTRHAIQIWREKNWLAKLNDSIGAATKQRLINVLNQQTILTKHGKLNAILRAFDKLRKTGSIQKRFMDRLLKTKFGGAILTFQKWKALPERKDNVDYQNASKFMIRLSNFHKRVLKISYDPLKEIYYDGINKKRYCIKKLLLKTMSQHQRLFKHWENETKNYHHIRTCKLTYNFCHTLQSVMQSHVSMVLGNDKQQKIKYQTLSMMFSNHLNKFRQAFQIWRNVNQVYNIRASLSEQQKTTLLQAMVGFMKNNKNALLRDSLNAFGKQIKAKSVMRKIHLRLLNTVAGGMFDSFNKWKSIPENQDSTNYKKFSVFNQSLSKFYLKFLKNHSWISLLDIKDDAQAKQKKACNKILWLGRSDVSKAFYKWYKVKNEDKIIAEMARRNIQLHDEITKIRLLGWFSTGSKARQAQLSQILYKFKMNSLRGQVVKKFYKSLCNTSAGGVFQSFNKWKQIPERDNNDDLIKGSKFEKKLLFFCHRMIRKSFVQFKDIHEESIMRKKRAILLFMRSQESGTKKYFNRWANEIKLLDQAKRCKVLMNFFFTLNKCAHSNYNMIINQKDQTKLRNVLRLMCYKKLQAVKHGFLKWHKLIDISKVQQKGKYIFAAFSRLNEVQRKNAYPFFEEQMQKKPQIDALQKLLQEMEALFKDSYQKWKETKEKLNLVNDMITNDCKRDGLRLVALAFKNKKLYQLRQCLLAFHRKTKKGLILKKLFFSLQGTTTGGMLFSFQRWKQIPESNNANLIKATKFEKKLHLIMNRSFKKSFSPFTDIWYDGQAIKKRMMLLFMKTNESQLKSYLSKWSNWRLMRKEEQRCKNVIKLFQTLNKITSKNAYLKQDSNKRNLVAMMFRQNKLSQMNQALTIWRGCLNVQTDDRSHRIHRGIFIAKQFITKLLTKRFQKWKYIKEKQQVVEQAQSIAKMIHLDKVVEKAVKMRYFNRWRPSRQVNPWMKRAAAMIAKFSRISAQVSYWRMRDNAVQGGNSMNMLKSIKMKKMSTALIKAVHRTITKAFTQIEQTGKLDQSLMAKSFTIQNLQTGQNKLAAQIICRVLRNNFKNIFLDFSLQTSTAYKKLLKNSLPSNQYKFILKSLGASQMGSWMVKQLVKNEISFLIMTRQRIKDEDQLDNADILEDYNQLIEENETLKKEINTLIEIKDENEQKLEEAYDNIDNLNNKLSIMVGHRFFQLLTDYQDRLVEEAFNKIYDR